MKKEKENNIKLNEHDSKLVDALVLGILDTNNLSVEDERTVETFKELTKIKKKVKKSGCITR